MTWSSGDAVAWRSVKDGTIRTAMPLIVVRDEPDLIALYRPVGSVYKRRTGERWPRWSTDAALGRRA